MGGDQYKHSNCTWSGPEVVLITIQSPESSEVAAPIWYLLKSPHHEWILTLIGSWALLVWASGKQGCFVVVVVVVVVVFLLIQNLNCSDTLHRFQWIFNELLSSRSAVHAPHPPVLWLFWRRRCHDEENAGRSDRRRVRVRRELLLRSGDKTADTWFVDRLHSNGSSEKRAQDAFHRFVFVQCRGQDWGSGKPVRDHIPQRRVLIYTACFWKHEIMEQKPSNQSLL